MNGLWWIGVLADNREVRVEFVLGEDPNNPARTAINIDDGARCDWTYNTEFGINLAHAASLIHQYRGSYVVEWRRRGEPSKAEMRAALEKAVTVLAEIDGIDWVGVRGNGIVDLREALALARAAVRQ